MIKKFPTCRQLTYEINEYNMIPHPLSGIIILLIITIKTTIFSGIKW